MHNRRQHSIVCLQNLLFLLKLLAPADGQDSHSCPPAQLDSRGLVQHPCSWGREPVGPVFPTDNTARSASGRELHELLAANSQHGNSSSGKGGLVVLFYLAGDPPSM